MLLQRNVFIREKAHSAHTIYIGKCNICPLTNISSDARCGRLLYVLLKLTMANKSGEEHKGGKGTLIENRYRCCSHFRYSDIYIFVCN